MFETAYPRRSGVRYAEKRTECVPFHRADRQRLFRKSMFEPYGKGKDRNVTSAAFHEKKLNFFQSERRERSLLYNYVLKKIL